MRTKMLHKGKVRKDGKVDKYKCRLVAQGLRIGGLHYTEKYSPTSATASIRMLMVTAAAKAGELRHFDVGQANLKAMSDDEEYIEIPEVPFSGVVGKLNKAIQSLVQAGRCWNIKFCDMTTTKFEQSRAHRCMFRKVVDGVVRNPARGKVQIKGLQ